MTRKFVSHSAERGSLMLGFIIGLLVGLVLALGIALYVTKTPVPFINKAPSRTAEQDAEEAKRNKDWDPNAPLQSKSAVKPPAAVTPIVPGAKSPAAKPVEPKKTVTPSDRPATTAAAPAAAPAAAAPPAPSPDSITYFVQAGAFQRNEEAEQQRARLAMIGFTAKITEREQSGRTVYRVRVGPYDKKEEAEKVQERLNGNGIETALVRAQK